MEKSAIKNRKIAKKIVKSHKMEKCVYFVVLHDNIPQRLKSTFFEKKFFIPQVNLRLFRLKKFQKNVDFSPFFRILAHYAL